LLPAGALSLNLRGAAADPPNFTGAGGVMGLGCGTVVRDVAGVVGAIVGAEYACAGAGKR